MSFVWKRPEGRLSTPEDTMRIIIRVVDELNMPDKRGAAICAGMCVAQESDFWRPWNAADPESRNYPFDSQSDDGRSVGLYQQQKGPGGELWWGPTSQEMDPYLSTSEFLTRLKKNGYNASNAQTANDSVQAVQRSGVPHAYAKHWDRINALYDSVKGGAPAPDPAPPTVPYGLPRGSNSGGYGGNGVRFPDWVYQLGDAFGVKPSTYPGHQEGNRNEAGYAPNPNHENRGIDWAAPGAPDQWDRLTRFADYLATIPQHLEQVIWQNPQTMRSIEVAGGRHQPGYFRADLAGHRDHVHTRQSRSIPLPGRTQPTPAPPRPASGWRGDPVWLPDVLREAGLVCHVYPGAFERGHGDMGQIWGVMAHHTGSFGETPKGIAEHPSLGLASQLYLGRNGEYTLCGVGKAWHGGTGSYPGIADVNGTLIGIEAANDGGGTPGKPHRSSWSDAQYDAYTRGVAAILGKLGYGSDRVIGHKEWAGKSQGKWDPGAIDMNIFRADVAARLTTAPPSTGDDELTPEQDQMLRTVFRELTQRHPSRSAVREPGEGPVDTWAGMDLNTDGNVDLLATWLRAQFRFTPAVERLKRVAAGGEPGRNAEDALLAQAMLAELYKAKPTAAAVVPAVVNNAAPVADTRQLEAEIARLSDQFESLRIAVNNQSAPPNGTEIATAIVAGTTAERIGNLVGAVRDGVELGLTMDQTDRAALTASTRILQLENGSKE